MAKSIFEKAAEKALLIMVGEAARKFAKATVATTEQKIKERLDTSKAKRVASTSLEDEPEEVIE